MDFSYEELIQELINLKVQEHDTIWKQAAICAVLVERMEVKPGDVGAELNCSGKRIKKLVKTFLAFPGNGSRVPELTFSHHEIAAGMDNPAAWLEKAVQEQWSVRQMKEAIKQEKGQVPDEEKEAARAWAKIEKILEAGGPGAMFIRQKIHEAGLAM